MSSSTFFLLSFFCPIKLKLDRTKVENAELSTFAEAEYYWELNQLIEE